MLKPLNSRYRLGYRGWIKIRRRDTTEAIIGAITGTLTRPSLLILARLDAGGRLRAVGRSVPLRPEQSRRVGERLVAAEPGHPWTGVRFASSWGSRDVLDAVLVRPELVAEISAWKGNTIIVIDITKTTGHSATITWNPQEDDARGYLAVAIESGRLADALPLSVPRRSKTSRTASPTRN
ncbi:hypothetical protein [Streptomyces sp. NPDC012746]|uniref:hypothetical protein n=1 Tax=Streptomyces sp. NPDC012746 TaxID=3364845 RepID=UPI00367C5BC5